MSEQDKYPYATPYKRPVTIDQCTVGQYLMIRKWSAPTEITQGTLIAKDTAKGIAVLKSQNYDNKVDIVSFDDIAAIDNAHTGSGALAAVQEGDWVPDGSGGYYRRQLGLPSLDEN